MVISQVSVRPLDFNCAECKFGTKILIGLLPFCHLSKAIYLANSVASLVTIQEEGQEG